MIVVSLNSLCIETFWKNVWTSRSRICLNCLLTLLITKVCAWRNTIPSYDNFNHTKKIAWALELIYVKLFNLETVFLFRSRLLSLFLVKEKWILKRKFCTCQKKTRQIVNYHFFENSLKVTSVKSRLYAVTNHRQGVGTSRNANESNPPSAEVYVVLHITIYIHTLPQKFIL